MTHDRHRTFARHTLRRRIPVILANAEEGLDAEAVGRLREIGRMLADDAPMEMELRDFPFAGWDGLPARVNGRLPSTTSFIDVEFWMYFRVLEAVRFVETRTDPFRATKQRDLDRHLAWAESVMSAVGTLEAALELALHANAHDLSQIARPQTTQDVGRSTLAIADGSISRLNLIADNFGAEFLADLILAIVAAERGIEVVVHVKQLPMFVSDVTADDVRVLCERTTHRALGARLSAAMDRGLLRFADHSFWSSPLFFDHLPVAELTASGFALNVLKGDLNFRRAVGDVNVPIDTPFEALAVRPPVSMLSLRSVKSYCVAGMSEWPDGVSGDDFPMDGSIIVAQRIPAMSRASSSKVGPADGDGPRAS